MTTRLGFAKLEQLYPDGMLIWLEQFRTYGDFNALDLFAFYRLRETASAHWDSFHQEPLEFPVRFQTEIIEDILPTTDNTVKMRQEAL